MILRHWMALTLLTASASAWAGGCPAIDSASEQQRLSHVLGQLKPQLARDGVSLELTPLTALPAMHAPKVRLVGQTVRSRVAVELEGQVCGAGQVVRTTVWFKLRALKEAWVYGRNGKAQTPLAGTEPRRGTVDLAALQVEASELPERLDGLWLLQSVNAGTPILKRHLGEEPLVQRSSPVTVLVYGQGVMLRVQGKAMGPGALGDTVPVLVNGAESSLLAVVSGKGEVHVE
jgi:flagella basal body P-ring formation protein FlgA